LTFCLRFLTSPMADLVDTRRPEPLCAVIFDMDGVLTDSEPLINSAAIAMFKEKGLVVQPEDFLPFVGTGEDRYIGGVAEKYQFALDLPAAKRRTYEIYLALVPRELRSFPGATELVNACRQNGLRIAVASSADGVKIEANLRQIGLPPETWDAIVVGEEVINKKPAPDIFLSAAARLGLSASQCVVIEDAVNGVEAAKAAGMRCVAVAQTFPPDRLQKADLVRPNLLAVSVADLFGAPEVPPTPSTPPAIPETVAPALEQPRRAWGFWATIGLTFAIFAGATIAQVFGAFLWAMITRRGTSQDLVNNGLLLGLATCVSAPVTVGLSYLFAHIRVGAGAAAYLGFGRWRWKEFLRWAPALLLLVALSDLLTWLLGRPIVPEFMFKTYETAGFLPLFWLALLLAAPVAEETLFRGFLFEGLLRSRVGLAGALGLTSLVWAVIHLQYDAYGMATIFVSGLLLGYIRFRTGSIIVTMCLHGLMNLIASVELLIALQMRA
jgi:HAD superfamily hydrolase (TIGR01509 family)